MTEPILVEVLTTIEGNYTVHWHVQPPEPDVRHIVTRQTWSDDYSVRHVYEWQPVTIAAV